MKVGSDREAASSPELPNHGVGEIGSNHVGLCVGGPSKIGPVSGEYIPKKKTTKFWGVPVAPELSWCVCFPAKQPTKFWGVPVAPELSWFVSFPAK